jgi:hypothetical protein
VVDGRRADVLDCSMSWRKTVDHTRDPLTKATEELEKELREIEDLGWFQGRLGGPSGVPMLVLNAIAIAATVWGLYFRRGDGIDIAALVAIPPAAMLLLLFGPGKYSVENGPRDIRSTLGVPLFLPGFVLFFRALEVSLLDWKPLLRWTGWAVAIAAVLFLVGDRRVRKRWFMLPVLALSFAPYPWAVLRFANVVLDRAEGEAYRAKVLEKLPRSDDDSGYELRIAPWGPVLEEEDHEVGRAAYEVIEVGHPVCPRLFPGRLGFRWYALARCDDP